MSFPKKFLKLYSSFSLWTVSIQLYLRSSICLERNTRASSFGNDGNNLQNKNRQPLALSTDNASFKLKTYEQVVQMFLCQRAWQIYHFTFAPTLSPSMKRFFSAILSNSNGTSPALRNSYCTEPSSPFTTRPFRPVIWQLNKIFSLKTRVHTPIFLSQFLLRQFLSICTHERTRGIFSYLCYPADLTVRIRPGNPFCSF